MVQGKGCSLRLSCNAEQLESVLASKGNWARVALGSVSLKSGDNTLKLDIEGKKGVSLDALELVKQEVKAAGLKEALSMRRSPRVVH